MTPTNPTLDADVKIAGATYTPPKEKEGVLTSDGYVSSKLDFQSGRPQEFINSILKFAGSVCVVEMTCTPPPPDLSEKDAKLYEGSQPPAPEPFTWAGLLRFGKMTLDDPKDSLSTRLVTVPFTVVTESKEEQMAFLDFRLEMARYGPGKAAMVAKLFQPKLGE